MLFSDNQSFFIGGQNWSLTFKENTFEGFCKGFFLRSLNQDSVLDPTKQSKNQNFLFSYIQDLLNV